MQKRIEQITLFLIGLTFFVPLVLVPSSFIFPFIVPKILLFRTLTLLIFGGFIILLSSNWERYQIRFTSITAAVVVWLMSFTISTFVGVDWYHSFWDNHERMLGLFTFFHYVLYYFAVTSVVHEWRDWRWLLRAFLFAGGIVMFIAFLQQLPPYQQIFLNQSGSRSAATLGNPIYVGGYGLFLSFLGWLLFMKEEKKWWRIFGLFGSLLGVAGIFFSGTRGSLLGWGAGVGVLWLWYVFAFKGHKTIRRTLSIVLGIAVLLGALIFAFRTTDFVRGLPAVGTLVDLSLTSGTAQTRLMAWGIAIEAWQGHPIFGWGPNNFFYAFNKYYRPEFLEHGWGETWFDNAHNILMNTLAVQGLTGLLAYLALFVTVWVVLWRQYRRGQIDLPIASVGTAFMAAHLVQNCFVFENPTSFLYFFFFLAFINQRVAGVGETLQSAVESAPRAGTISPGVGVVVGLLAALLIYSTDLNAARANTATLATLRSLYGGQDPIGVYARAQAFPSPHIDDIRNDFARTAFTVIPNYVQAGQTDYAKQLLRLANDELRKNRILHPWDVRTHLQQVQLAQQAQLFFRDASLLIDSEATMAEALQLSPKRQLIQYLFATVELSLNRPDMAVALLKQSIENDPKIGEGWWRLALLYQEIGKVKEAKEVVRQARALGVGFDDHGAQVINSILPPVPATGTKK